MFPAGTRLDHGARIGVLDALGSVNAALLELLDEFTVEDWTRPTVHPQRNVKDLTAHLLQGSLWRVSTLRDGYRPAEAPSATREELVRAIQRRNREFMAALRPASPALLRELLARYDAELLGLFSGLEPEAPGLGVVWAGEWVSPNWFDVAREYTEKWHHQQQLRDATGRRPLTDPSLFVPALETFARALPFAYRNLAKPVGSSIAVSLGPPAGIGWTLRREPSAWVLYAGVDEGAPTSIDLDPDLAWRLWTKGIPPALAKSGVQIAGDPADAEPLLTFVAVMA
jgi:uncharacterized protein (TIGR03083 family)